MCGIAGILYFQRRSGPVEGVRRMTDAMRTRGPDDEGFVLFDADGRYRLRGGPDTPEDAYRATHRYHPEAPLEAALAPANLALGHRRLAILDLSPAGHQPMCTPDGRHWIAYNGEVYNFWEIRAELEALGERFETRSDTEVLLRAFARWGPACLQRLNGPFALAIWDARERVLFLARDRIGIRPLYYHRGEDFLIFASELPALFASGLCEPRVDAQGLYDGMSLLISPRPRTAFEGMRGLEPAHWMTVDDQGGLRSERWWSVPLGPVDYRRSEASYQEELEALLEKSVARRLVSDVEVGTFMSGGVDSTLITALAARQQPGIKAFTLAHEAGSGISELAEATAMARMLPVQHIVRETHDDHSIAYDQRMMRAYAEPFSSISPNYVISRLAKEAGAIVVLNGSGSDELFVGYERFLELPVWRRLQRLRGPLSLLPARGRLVKAQAMSALATVAEHFLFWFSPFDTAAKQALLRPGFLAQVAEPETARTLERLYFEPYGRFEDDIQASCQLELAHYVGNHFVARVDAFMMAFSLEGRFPFLDHEVVEFAMRLPSRLKLRKGERKRIVRRVAARHVHPSCLSMPKKGFTLPLAQWMEGPLRSFVEKKLTALAMDGEIFRPEAVLAIRDGRARPAPTPRQIWYLVSTQLWREAFFGATPA